MGFSFSYIALAKLRGVEPYEVLQVLAGRPMPVPARSADGYLWVMTFWGRTRTGRVLVVAARRRGKWNWEIVGAREATPAERAEYENWEAGR